MVAADASPAATEDRVPGSASLDICLDCGGASPRYVLEYDLRNVESNGREDNVGSFDS